MRFGFKYSLTKWLLILAFIACAQLILYKVTRPPVIKDMGAVPEVIINSIEPIDDLYAINFFASWCGACRQEHNLLLYLNQELNLPLYGIALSEDQNNLEEFLSKEGNPYKKLITTLHPEVLKMLKIDKIPRTLIIQKGRIIYDQKGPFNKFIIQQNIIPILIQAKNIIN